MRTLLLLALAIIGFNGIAQELKPTLTEALVNVQVTNMDGESTEGDKVIFTSTKSAQTFSGISDNNGKFQLLLPQDDTYEITLQSFEKNIEYGTMEIPKFEGYLTQNLNVSYELPKTYTLENIYFDTGKATLRAESTATLESLKEVMTYKKNMVIEISGHTDNVGDDAYNQKLSEERANAVKKYLITKGISENRVKTVGYGPTQPVASNDTEEGRQKNRRISISILQN